MGDAAGRRTALAGAHQGLGHRPAVGIPIRQAGALAERKRRAYALHLRQFLAQRTESQFAPRACPCWQSFGRRDGAPLATGLAPSRKQFRPGGSPDHARACVDGESPAKEQAGRYCPLQSGFAHDDGRRWSEGDRVVSARPGRAAGRCTSAHLTRRGARDKRRLAGSAGAVSRRGNEESQLFGRGIRPRISRSSTWILGRGGATLTRPDSRTSGGCRGACSTGKCSPGKRSLGRGKTHIRECTRAGT